MGCKSTWGISFNRTLHSNPNIPWGWSQFWIQSCSSAHVLFTAIVIADALVVLLVNFFVVWGRCKFSAWWKFRWIDMILCNLAYCINFSFALDKIRMSGEAERLLYGIGDKIDVLFTSRQWIRNWLQTVLSIEIILRFLYPSHHHYPFFQVKRQRKDQKFRALITKMEVFPLITTNYLKIIHSRDTIISQNMQYYLISEQKGLNCFLKIP